MQEPKVAVLVINYNGKHFLKACLESLEKQTYKNYEVYIVDNASTDGSIEYVKQHFPWVKTIVFSENLGFAKAYNEATRIVNADYAVFLNNDTKVDANWLSELVKGALEDESVVAVGSKILFYAQPGILQHAGAQLALTGGGIDVGQYEKDDGKYDKRRLVGAVCGAAMLVRKDGFLKLGGFDDDFFAYFEDTDFCWRVWLHGYKVIYVPTSVVYHKFGGSWGPLESPRRIFLAQKNQAMSMIKNFELRNLVQGLILLLVYSGVKTLVFLRHKSYRSVFAMISASHWVLQNLRKVVYKRFVVQNSRVLSDKFLIDNGLIIGLKESILEFLRLQRFR
jgi:hypothetical protein